MISFKLENFPDNINQKIENLKGGWRFQKLRNDKSSANYINTYENIKICIKENLHMEEILLTVEKNLKIIQDKKNEERKKYSQDLNEEKNFMSALVWKRFFKQNKKDDISEFDDLDFFNVGKKEDNKDNEFLNKKRKKSDEDKQSDEEIEKVDEKEKKDDDSDDDDGDNFDKLIDDDYDDDCY